MTPENRDLLKEVLVRINQTRQGLRSKADETLHLDPLKRSLIRLYLKSPHKLQYALAKFGVKLVVKKKKRDMQEFMRH